MAAWQSRRRTEPWQRERACVGVAREVRGPEAEDRRRSQGTVGAFAREGERCGGGGPPRTALLQPLPTGRGQVAGLGPSRGDTEPVNRPELATASAGGGRRQRAMGRESGGDGREGRCERREAS